MSLDAFPVYTVEVAVASGGTDRDSSLDGINTNHLETGVLGYVRTGPAAERLFRLDTSSSAPPDGLTVIQPLTGPGRWLLLITTAAGTFQRTSWAQLTQAQVIGGNTTNGIVPDNNVPGANFVVVMPNVTPGNVVECDYAFLVVSGSDAPGFWSVQTQLIVSFSAAAVPPSASYQKVNFASAGVRTPSTDDGAGTTPCAYSMSGFGSVVVPPGATKATFAVLFNADATDGSGPIFNFGMLRARELPIGQVSGAVPFTLAPI